MDYSSSRPGAVGFVRDSVRDLCVRLGATTVTTPAPPSSVSTAAAAGRSNDNNGIVGVTSLCIVADDDDDDASTDESLLPRTRAEARMLIEALSNNATLRRIRIRLRGRRHEEDADEDDDQQQQEAAAAAELFVSLFVSRVLPHHPSLEYVDLSSNRLSQANIEGIGSALQLSGCSIRALSLADNDLGPEDVRALLLGGGGGINPSESSPPASSKLETLHLDRNPGLGNHLDSCRAISSSFVAGDICHNLKVLTLGMCNIGDRTGGLALADAISKNHVLTSLYLSYNQLGNDTLEALAKGLRHNDTLTNLCLSHNQFEVTAAAGSTTAAMQPIEMLKETLRCTNFALEACTLILGSLLTSSSTASSTTNAVSAKQEHHGRIIRDLCSSNRKLKRIYNQKLLMIRKRQQISRDYGTTATSEIIFPLGCWPHALQAASRLRQAGYAVPDDVVGAAVSVFAHDIIIISNNNIILCREFIAFMLSLCIFNIIAFIWGSTHSI